jgi:uncharacterized cupredoxin-like copper-binding protein
VTIAVAPSGQVSVDKTTLTFTPSNWNVAQTVTVTAVNDNVAEGAHAGTITHTAASTDAAYNGLSVAGVTAQITDNDTAGVQIVQSGGSTSVAEGGATDSYTVVLASQPTANVTVAVAPSSQVTVDKTTLTFTPSNWNVAQTVTVTAVNDNVAEGAHTGTITHNVTSTDAKYNGFSTSSVTAQITDNEPVAVTLSDATLADFSAGSANSGILVTDLTGGAVTLAPQAGSDFTGTTLPAGWTNRIWFSGGTTSVSGGQLRVDGAAAYPSATYNAGRSLEFCATFTSDAYQHIGFGVDLNNAPWAIFSTGSGGGLSVRTNNGTTNLSTPISGTFIGSTHRYRIDWSSSSVTYSVDGVVVATHSIAITTAMRPMVSDYTPGGNGLQADWLRMSAFAASGSFQSRVFDGGDTVSWSTASWSSTAPSGCSVKISVRTGNTPTPDASWTSFVLLPGSGSPVGTAARYLQYRADLTTSSPNNPDLIPVLSDVTFAVTPAVKATFTTNGPVAENSPATVQFSVTNDPGNLHYSFALTPDGLAADYASAGTVSSKPYTFNDNGTYTVYGRIFTPDNCKSDFTATVSVTNVAPTATLVSNGPVTVGTPATFSISNPFDPSSVDVSAGFHYSFALSSSGLATSYSAAGTSASQAFAFPNGGNYAVYGRIFDKDNGFADYTTSVAVAGPLSDTTRADFALGTPDAGILLTDVSGGGVTLAPQVGSDFSGTALPTGWASTTWHSGGTSKLSDGLLRVDGTGAYTNATYSSGRSLQFMATFASDSNQHIGFAVDLNNAPWAIFSTGNGGGLNVRTSVGTTKLTTPISNSFLGSPHLYRIDWSSSGITYWVDGVVVASHTAAITTAMRPWVSDYFTGGNSLTVDWLRMSPYAATGTYLSRVFDGGPSAAWGSASWSATVPTGAGLTISVRTGNTPTPDASWTTFVPLTGSGASVAATSRYLQYRAVLTTTKPYDPTAIPVLNDITIARTAAAMGASAATGAATMGAVVTPQLAGPTAATATTAADNYGAVVEKVNPSTMRALPEANDRLDAILQQLAERHIRANRTMETNGDLHDEVFGTVARLGDLS